MYCTTVRGIAYHTFQFSLFAAMSKAMHATTKRQAIDLEATLLKAIAKWMVPCEVRWVEGYEMVNISKLGFRTVDDSMQIDRNTLLWYGDILV